MVEAKERLTRIYAKLQNWKDIPFNDCKQLFEEDIPYLLDVLVALQDLREPIAELSSLVKQQETDPAINFEAEFITEAYLQNQIKVLHHNINA
ncbi:MAG: hypothetical protein GY809_31965, partial [Planctomycetes bacterium]|nr:hypothetical protein [Planctomycetota bacterium]